MKQIVYLSFLIILVLGCEKEEINSSIEENSILTVKWKRFHSEVSNEKDNSMVYIYDSEEEYKSQNGNPIYSASLADISPVGGGTITMVDSATFYNLKPIKYWIKIFNTVSYHKMIEHNQDLSFTLQNPLINNTITTVTVPTEKIFVNSYTIQKVEIYDIPSWINSNIDSQVQLKVFESYPEGMAGDDVVMDSKIITIDNSFIRYEPVNVTIDKINSWYPNYYIILSDVGSSREEFYEINIFELMNTFAHFGNEYINYNSMGGIKYKLYITWNY